MSYAHEYARPGDKPRPAITFTPDALRADLERAGVSFRSGLDGVYCRFPSIVHEAGPFRTFADAICGAGAIMVRGLGR